MKTLRLTGWDAGDWERYLARLISGSWALFWIWFGVASGISEETNLGGVMLHTLAPGLVFALLAVLGWWRPHAGGITLILTGLLTYAAYYNMAGSRGTNYWFTVGSMLALPQLIAGALFVASSHHSRRTGA